VPYTVARTSPQSYGAASASPNARYDDRVFASANSKRTHRPLPCPSRTTSEQQRGFEHHQGSSVQGKRSVGADGKKIGHGRFPLGRGPIP